MESESPSRPSARKSLDVTTERVYSYLKEVANPNAYVVLVDRLWPRGVKKVSLNMDEHLPDLGPSHGLRKWFGHEPARWEAFKEKYWKEIVSDPARFAALERLRDIATSKPLLLLFSARNETHNQAVALKEFLTYPVAPSARKGYNS